MAISIKKTKDNRLHKSNSKFMDEDFLLQNDFAKMLYHDFAKPQNPKTPKPHIDIVWLSNKMFDLFFIY